MKRHFLFAILNLLAASLKANSSFAAPSWQSCNLEQHGSSLADARCTHIIINDQNSGFLNVLKLPSFSDKKTAPIVIITGGPGTSAAALAAHYRYWFYKAQKEHDLLFIDQRGTGKSMPFDCKLDETGDANELYQDPVTLLKTHHQKIIDCITPYQKTYSLESISTLQAAKDIETVRQQLGYENLLLWGNSYGTRVAIAYQQLYPSHVKATVLDGVAPIEIALPSHAQQDAEQALGKLFKYCDESDYCPNSFKPLRSHWESILTKLEQGQANKTPITIELTDAKTQQLHTVELTPAMVANWVRFILYNRELTALLPLAIFQANNGNFSTLTNIAKVASDCTDTQVSAAMHAVILCREDYYFRKNTSGNSSLLPFGSLTDLTTVCEHIHGLVPPAPIPPNTTPKDTASKDTAPKDTTTDKAPTLLLSGEFDPVTPPKWAELVMAQLKNSAHIVINGGHHGVTPLGCVTDLVNQFLMTSAPLKDATIKDCTEAIKPAPPFIDTAGPKLPRTSIEGEGP